MHTGRAAAFTLLLLVPTIGGCGGSDAPTDLASQIQGLDAVEALALANEWRTTHPEVGTTLKADAVEFVLPGGEIVAVPLPEETMVLAVAPYVTSTHPCAIHSVLSCSGEMAGVPVWVHAETPLGAVLIDEEMTPMENGFLELWLPRDMEIDLTIQAGSLAATARVTTYPESNTCITTMQLE